MFTRRKKIKLDSFEEDIVVASLYKTRNERIKNNECDEAVSDVLIKILKTPQRKARRRDEAR